MFGAFGNKDIEYSLDSYFYRASEDMVRQYSMYMGGGNSEGMRKFAYSQAFNSAVLYSSYLYKADKAGIRAGNKETDEYIIMNNDVMKINYNTTKAELLSKLIIFDSSNLLL